MAKFSKQSEKLLADCHISLQKLFYDVVKQYDCTIICGYRNEDDQNRAFSEGKSKLKYPQSKHNHNPSLAVDVVPYPIDWKDTKRMYDFGFKVMEIAKKLGINIRWGADWDGDHVYTDEKFIDLPHFELKS